jgi:hypothetical protein
MHILEQDYMVYKKLILEFQNKPIDLNIRSIFKSHLNIKAISVLQNQPNNQTP